MHNSFLRIAMRSIQPTLFLCTAAWLSGAAVGQLRYSVGPVVIEQRFKDRPRQLDTVRRAERWSRYDPDRWWGSAAPK